MHYDAKSGLQRELTWFLVAYLAMLLGVLLGVHVLQSGAPAGALQTPARQHRLVPPKQAIAVPADASGAHTVSAVMGEEIVDEVAVTVKG